MQIKRLGSDKFEIKNKDVCIEISKKLIVNGFEFPGPGEYEKGGVIISGIADGGDGNVIFNLMFEEINICYLGHITHELNEDEIKQIGNVDILFLPLGEEGTLNVKLALKLLSNIDPRVVIPMLYSDLTEFLKSEASFEEAEVYKVKKTDLPSEERKIVIIRQ